MPTSQSDNRQDRVLTVGEAARLVRKDPETIRRWIRRGVLTARKPGKDFLIKRSDLESCGLLKAIA